MNPNPAIVLKLIEAFRWSKTMFAAASLGIFDLLAKQGPLSARAVSDVLQSNEDATARLLDGCVALELLSKTDGIYANTATADRYLRNDSEHTLIGYILYSNDA